MKLAILMSTYNGEKYLKEQIDSILNQKTELDFDLIVRDDGSTDNTKNILKEYALQKNFKYSLEDNCGAALGFLKLLKCNPGYDYYAFSDQDDIWFEDKIQKAFEKIKDYNDPIIYCSNCKLVTADLNDIGRNTHRKDPSYSLESVLCLASCAQGCTSFFNRSLANVVQENPLPSSIIMHDSLMTCLCAMVGGRIVYDPTPTMLYRIHGNNVIGVATKKQNGIKGVINSRIKEIFTRRKISMSDQIESILNTYSSKIEKKNYKTYLCVINSKKSMLSRLKLIINPRLRCDTINKTIAKKISILLGNN